MKYIKGNLLTAPVEALINTVNTVGVMGKGIALQFKERFPENRVAYERACKAGEMKIGKMLVVRENTTEGEKIIINFPTKNEWFKKSQYNYIEEGLNDLVRVIKEFKIHSIAIPPLGCGNGGLLWTKVKTMIESSLGDLKDIEILIYEPNDAVKEILQKEELKKAIHLTPGRAMILYALFKYERFGEPATVFAANKLAYFLQESGENLRLKFEQHTYGPYAQAMDKVLYALNGKYLKGLEQMSAGPFEPIHLNYERYNEVVDYINKELSSEQKSRLDNLFKAIDGFESTLSLEVLSSTHFAKKKHPELSRDQLVEKVQWTERKRHKISHDYVSIAYDHLIEYNNTLLLTA
jgi:O-acetyl-ADP-ribose deacetylase (regulator of RNase III)